MNQLARCLSLGKIPHPFSPRVPLRDILRYASKSDNWDFDVKAVWAFSNASGLQLVVDNARGEYHDCRVSMYFGVDGRYSIMAFPAKPVPETDENYQLFSVSGSWALIDDNSGSALWVDPNLAANSKVLDCYGPEEVEAMLKYERVEAVKE